jgi:hypothetical protein
MERSLVELTGHQLKRVSIIVRDARPPGTKTNLNLSTCFRPCMISARNMEIAEVTDRRKCSAVAGGIGVVLDPALDQSATPTKRHRIQSGSIHHLGGA